MFFCVIPLEATRFSPRLYAANPEIISKWTEVPSGMLATPSAKRQGLFPSSENSNATPEPRQRPLADHQYLPKSPPTRRRSAQ